MTTRPPERNLRSRALNPGRIPPRRRARLLASPPVVLDPAPEPDSGRRRPSAEQIDVYVHFDDPLRVEVRGHGSLDVKVAVTITTSTGAGVPVAVKLVPGTPEHN